MVDCLHCNILWLKIFSTGFLVSFTNPLAAGTCLPVSLPSRWCHLWLIGLTQTMLNLWLVVNMTGVHRAEPKELKLWHSIPPTMAHLNPFFNTSLCTKEPSSKAWFWRWWSAAWPLASNCDIYSHWQYLTIPHSTGLLQRTTARCNLCHRFFALMIGLYVTTLLVEIDVVSGDFGAGDTLTLDGAPPSSCPPKHLTGWQSHLPLSLLKNMIYL